jgi:two-component system, cell cycle sensor histidine kinase and response regulator CckA
MRILYVEDNPMDAELVRRELQRRDPLVVLDVAPSLAAARQRLLGPEVYEVVLCDMSLPDGTGLELVREIRAEGRRLAVVVLTGSGEEAAVAALQAGANDFLSKNDSLYSRLPATLEAALDRFRVESEYRARTLRVLYAEADDKQLEPTLRHLQAPHFNVEVVGSVAEVLRRLPTEPSEGAPWDVLLVDYSPGSSTLEALKVLRVDRRLDIPAVLLVPRGSEEVALLALRLGAAAYLIKEANDLYGLPATLEAAHRSMLFAREQASLRDSQARLAGIVDAAMDAVVTIDAEQRIVQFNPAAEAMFRCARSEAMGQSIERFIPERFEGGVRQHVSAVVPSGVSSRAARLGTIVGRRADGVEFPLEATISKVCVAGQDLFTAVLRDITERTLDMERLRESELRFRQLAENILEVFWMTDPASGQVLYLSPAYERVWGRNPESVYADSRAWLEAIHVDDRPGLLAALKRQNEKGYDEEYRIVRPDGSMRWIHDRAFLVRRDTGEISRVVGVAEDITERKSAEARRSELEFQLRHSQKMEAVGRLAGGVAHDFNNMLTVILGYLDLMLISASSIDPVRENLIEIQKAAQRSAEITRQLLAFSRRQTITPRVLDLNAQIAGVERLLRRAVGENIILDFALAEGLWHVKMDPTQIDQVLANLAVNARDAMPNGGRLTIESSNVTLDADYCRLNTEASPGDHVLLAVRDSGCGMNEETLERALEPFFTTKPEGMGTGLGLSMVYGIVRQNGGSLAIRSKVGQGTTVFLYLPRGRGTSVPVTEVAAAAPAKGHETILLTEDDEAVRRLAQLLLAQMGYKVLVAAGPAEAIALCEKYEGAIDLLFTDVVMPGTMDGIELANFVARLRSGPGVLLTSGFPAVRTPGRRTNQTEFPLLGKPYRIDDLAHAVREALDRRRERSPGHRGADAGIDGQKGRELTIGETV